MKELDEQKAHVRSAISEYISFMNEAPAKVRSTETYDVEGGRKYLRIVACENGSARKVHCFVDALNADVYMAATYTKPMLNGARFNLLNADSFAELKKSWDPFGSYLYKKR